MTPLPEVISLGPSDEREREREREIHYVHSASLAYEDGIVFMSEPSALRSKHPRLQYRDTSKISTDQQHTSSSMSLKSHTIFEDGCHNKL